MLVESDGQLKVAHAHLTRLGAGEAPAEDE
jgi:hypothetical protein